jgi:cytochrome c oxidase subunit IV
MMEQRRPTLAVYFAVWLALMALLGVTLLAALPDLGALNTLIALAIAAVKAGLIILYFMHDRYAGRATWIFAGAAFFWLAILVTLTMSDFLTRGWTPGANP